MNSRDKILSAVEANQPELVALPDMDFFKYAGQDNLRKFIDTLNAIGGSVIPVKTIADVRYYMLQKTNTGLRVVTTVPLLTDILEPVDSFMLQPRSLDDVECAVIGSELAVAENGSVWLSEKNMGQRVLPFICQHLFVIVGTQNIVTNMHEAYEMISNERYGFGTFIAGPSKTADIEQSLVLGAHGPRSMTVFLIG